MASSRKSTPCSNDDSAMQPIPLLSSEHGFPGASMYPAGSRSPFVIQFVSNIIVGRGRDTLSCPSTRRFCGSSSDIEIEVLFHGGDYDDNDDCTSPAFPSRSALFRGYDHGEQDLEAGTSSLLRITSSSTEFIERNSKGELRWSASEGLRLSSTS